MREEGRWKSSFLPPFFSGFSVCFQHAAVFGEYLSSAGQSMFYRSPGALRCFLNSGAWKTGKSGDNEKTPRSISIRKWGEPVWRAMRRRGPEAGKTRNYDFACSNSDPWCIHVSFGIKICFLFTGEPGSVRQNAGTCLSLQPGGDGYNCRGYCGQLLRQGCPGYQFPGTGGKQTGYPGQDRHQSNGTHARGRSRIPGEKGRSSCLRHS